MKRSLRRGLAVFAVITAIVLAPGVAVAHPLGNFTVNTSAGIVLSLGAVRIDYVVDMAEIPTVQAMPELDTDQDGNVSDSEASVWAADRAPEVLSGLTLNVNAEPVPLEFSAARVALLPGQGGLDILRLEATFSGELDAEGELVFHDTNFEDRVGWHEVTAIGADGVAIDGSSVPARSVSDGLRTYPDDQLSSPLDIRGATLSFGPGASAPAGSPADGDVVSATGSSGRPGVSADTFAGAVDRNGAFMLLAVLLSFGFGALHALGPGHGKTLMAAYLVGSGGGIRHAVGVGGAVAAMHTVSVLALGIVVLSATEVFAPEAVYPWLALGSGLTALALGAWMLVVRLAGRGEPERHHDHSHPARAVLSRKGLTAIALAGGILPSPSALLVLLASVALHRVAYGLVLIGAFSLGLASALVAVGILALRTRDALAHRMSTRLGRLVPVASAAVIVLLGLVLTVNGATRV